MGINESLNDRKTHTKFELMNLLKHLHDTHPDIILMNMSSAINPCVVIKEAWKTAYPNECLPKFLTVDPRKFGSNTIRRNYDDWYHNLSPRKAELESLREISKGKHYALTIAKKIAKSLTGSEEITDKVRDKRILVFDECSSSFSGGPHNYITDFYEKGILVGSPLVVAFPLVDSYSFNNVWVDGGIPGEYIYKTLPKFSDLGGNTDQLFKRDNLDDVYRQLHGKKGKGVIKELKDIGREIGSWVRIEDETKKKSLEKRVAVASFLSIIFSAIFFSKLTGSVIGSVNQNSSGLILLFLGLFLAVYLFNLRKK